jgi:hypothetical protein
MKTYQKTDGALWAFEDDGSQDYLITADMSAITEAEADAIRLAKRPLPPPVTIVTPLQARRALSAAGLLTQVNTAIAAAPADTQMAWEFATLVQRSDPLIAVLSTTLGLTSAQVDALFTHAATL